MDFLNKRMGLAVEPLILRLWSRLWSWRKKPSPWMTYLAEAHSLLGIIYSEERAV